MLDPASGARPEAAHKPQAEMLRRMDLARNYNGWLLSRARAFLGRRVLDAGAGAGTFTDALAETYDVVALEPDSEFAAGLRERYADRRNVTVLEGDATELDPSIGPFDAIVCFNVLEHVSNQEGMLARLRAVLAPSGSLLLLVPAHPRLYGSMDRTVGHVRRYTRRDVENLLRQAGLTPSEVRYVNPIGALGWLVSARILRRTYVPTGPLRLYDRLVPVLRLLDGLRLPVGLSVWARATRSEPRETRSN
jgi:SAM-dependent methyltransferase